MADAADPILARLRQLDAKLEAFLGEREPRLLCWVLAPDEERMFDGFLALLRDEPKPGRLVLWSDEPFGARAAHGVSVVRSLEENEQERADALAAEDTYDIPWTAPSPPQRLQRQKGQPPPDQIYLRDALIDLGEQQGQDVKDLLLCLRPQSVSALEGYARWLSELGFVLSESALRVLVTASTDENFGPALVQANPRGARLVAADLDMPGALGEIAALATDSDEPAGRYRQSFLQAQNALGAGDFGAAVAATERATQIARVEGWSHLEFAAHQLLGGGALGLGDLRAAFVSFDKAEKATHHDIRFGATWLSPLLLQARLSKGTVALTGGAFALAARLFADEALPVARALADRRSELECLRLASNCEERRGDAPKAREHALGALAVGENMPAEERRHTTLAFVGEALLRSTRGLSQHRERKEIEQRMQCVLGKDWRQLAQAGSASPDESAAAAELWERSSGEVRQPGGESRGSEALAEQTPARLTATLTAALELPTLSAQAALDELAAAASQEQPLPLAERDS
jgi:hypothetical protein